MLIANHLIGFGVGGAELAPIVLIDSGFNNTSTVSLAGVQAGDLIVFMECALIGDGGLPPSSAVPSGYTSITTGSVSTSQGDRCTLSYKIATGGETSITAAMSVPVGSRFLFQMVFRAGRAIANVTAASVNSQATAGNPTEQTVTAASGTPPLIVFGSYVSSSAAGGASVVSPATFSPSEDGDVSQPTTAYRILKYKIYDTGPANTSVDMDDEGAGNVLQSFYLALS